MLASWSQSRNSHIPESISELRSPALGTEQPELWNTTLVASGGNDSLRADVAAASMGAGSTRGCFQVSMKPCGRAV